MSSPPRRAPRPSLSSTVVRLATVALLSAVLLWSVMFLDVVSKRTHAGTAPTQPTGQLPSSDGGQSAQAPAPVTTRTS
jgi:hypothetical protein